MTGYTRTDTSNNIANGNVIDADDLDLEFNAIEAAFNSSSGHTHDGSAAGGAPVTVIGPAQDIITSSLQMAPKASGTYNLGSVSYKWKDLHVNGVAYVGSIDLNGTAITATAAELNLLDGVTASTAELNLLDGLTATTAELNTLDGITATVSELNTLDGITATVSELNTLDGITATVTELNYTDGVTSAIQTQLNNKQPLDAGLTSISALTTSADKMIYTTASDTYATASLTSAGRALLDDANAAAQLVTLGLTATATELNYVDGVTSAIQTQLNAKAPTASPTFTGTVTIPTADITTANITTVDLGDWTIRQSGVTLIFAYGGIDVAKIDSVGGITSASNITAYGTI